MLRKSFFTLIELIIVVAIIGILVSLLIPSLRRAKDISIRTACLSNQKHVGVAWYRYLQENNGVFPPVQHGWGGFDYYRSGDHVKVHWASYQVYLDEFTNNKETYKCPEDIRSGTKSPVDKFIHNYSLPSFNGMNFMEVESTDVTALGVDAGWMGLPTWAQRRIEARHLLGANVLWVDGHASSKSATSIGENPDWFTRYARYNKWTKTYDKTSVSDWMSGGPATIPGQ